MPGNEEKKRQLPHGAEPFRFDPVNTLPATMTFRYLMQHLPKFSTYDPNLLLNAIIDRLGLKDDNGLAKQLKLALSLIRNIRAGKTPVTATVMLAFHHATDISIDDLRRLAGDRRARFRPVSSINSALRISARQGDISYGASS